MQFKAITGISFKYFQILLPKKTQLNYSKTLVIKLLQLPHNYYLQSETIE